MALSIGELGESNEDKEVMEGVKMGPKVIYGFLLENNFYSIIYGHSSCVFSW